MMLTVAMFQNRTKSRSCCLGPPDHSPEDAWQQLSHELPWIQERFASMMRSSSGKLHEISLPAFTLMA